MMATKAGSEGRVNTRGTNPEPEADPALATDPSALLRSGKKQIHLTGFMGSGKSTVGRRLAQLLNWSFIDLDEAIAERAGLSVAEIFDEAGEAVFRALEDQLLLEISVVATTHEEARGVVVALGGGTLMDPDNREVCSAIATIIWLRCPVSVVKERCPEIGGERPLWGAAGDLEQRLAEREPGYRAAADFTVDAVGTPDEVVARVLAVLGEAG
jgi:shikimate kinase